MLQQMVDKKNSIGSYIILTWELVKMSILSAMEYRVAFLTQVVGMFVNDLFLLAIWIIFFQQFTVVNGWMFSDMIILYAVSTTSFGIVFTLFNGVMWIAQSITNGELDYYLTYPKNVLWFASVSRTMISAMGDMLFGCSLFFFIPNLTVEKFVIFLFVSILSAWILFSINAIVQSLGFFLGNFEDAATDYFHVLLGFSLYPQSAFHGILKILMFTIIPAVFVYSMPVDVIRAFNAWIILYIFLFALGAFLLALFIFNKGLKRYESGNLINVKT